MFYEPQKGDHRLPHSPFKALVAPRPIGWISTISQERVPNLAPYSYFNAVASAPDMVMFSSQEWKDSVENISKNGEFVCNYVSEDMIDIMNASSISAPYGVNEFEFAGIPSEESKLVSPPRVKGVAAALECRKTEIIELKDVEGNSTNHFLIIGQVVGVHIDDAYLKEGRFDVEKAKPPTRLGYMDYSKFGDVFELFRPKWEDK
ncbi:MAG: flavin reductase family protein [Salaquimonas sp.]